MKDTLMKVTFVFALVALLVSLIMAVLGVVGAVKITDGCLLRYDSMQGSQSTAVTNTITLKGNANNKIYATYVDGNSIMQPDPAHYGEWLSVNMDVTGGQTIKLQVEGELSLCQAYLPKNNIQNATGVDSKGQRILIPRIEDNLGPVPLIFDAKTDEWRNIAQLFRNDQVQVFIWGEKKPLLDAQGNVKADVQAVTQKDIINNITITADCREKKTTYSPICGRYSIYSGSYISACGWKPQCTYCGSHEVCEWGGCSPIQKCCFGKSHDETIWCGCWGTVTKPAPEPYQYDGLFTTPWSNDITKVVRDYNSFDCNQSSVQKYLGVSSNIVQGNCNDHFWYYPPGSDDENEMYCSTLSASDFGVTVKPTNTAPYLKERYHWFSANDATGILYRLDSSEDPTNKKVRGSNFSLSGIIPDDTLKDQLYKKILDRLYVEGNVGYLQYRFPSQDGKFTGNTGGVILGIKQTKCKRKNGQAFDDVFPDRGRIQYIIVNDTGDPNISSSNYQAQPITLNADGVGEFTVPSNLRGSLWMRIKNDPNDYKDSIGEYKVRFLTSVPTGSFTLYILTPLFERLTSMIDAAGRQVFKNMTCYEGGAGELGSCVNFFNYIKAILTIYIILYGMMFLLGMVKISQQDLVIRVVKIALISGLMNQKTFEFFNLYVFDFVTGFSSQIMANMSGYSLFTSANSISNPFMFMDAVMSKIFFSTTFLGQVLALISMGLAGMIYFVLIVVALGIVIITALKAIAVYLMAVLALALLIGLAPLFLTFMLFDFTRYLFDNWVKFTFRYMMEPVILMAGIIVLMQLFTIYLDYAVGYSVCWKCALPIKLPFPTIPGFSPAFANVEIFCINWFAPWGFDHRSGTMGINMQHIVALLMLSQCMYGYTELAGSMTTRLTSAGGPSATEMGTKMLSSIGNSIKNMAKSKAGGKGAGKEGAEGQGEGSAGRKGGPQGGMAGGGKPGLAGIAEAVANKAGAIAGKAGGNFSNQAGGGPSNKREHDHSDKNASKASNNEATDNKAEHNSSDGNNPRNSSSSMGSAIEDDSEK